MRIKCVDAMAKGARTARNLLQRRRRDMPCRACARRLRAASPCRVRMSLGSCLACLPMRNCSTAGQPRCSGQHVSPSLSSISPISSN
jgi:hypothetical protein